MIYLENEMPNLKDLEDLYISVGWENYLVSEYELTKLLDNADYYVTVFENDFLVGLIRVISDNLFIVFIQDILIHPEFQRRKIGHKLVDMVLLKFHSIRQIVLVTDNKEDKNKFYKSLMFSELGDFNCVGYMKMNF